MSSRTVTMQNDKITCGNVILANTGKRGRLTPDNDGYYLVNGGSFGRENRWGIIYKPDQYILDCISDGSDLRRRIERGEVYSEMGHPPMHYLENIGGQIVRTKITTMLEWVQRLKFLDPDRFCAHIREFIFDMTNFNRSTMTGYIDFVVSLKPFGPYGNLLRENLEAPDMNTSLSIRTVTAPQGQGDRFRKVEHWSNVDWVPEAGFAHATKHNSAGLESFLSGYVPLDGSDGITLSVDEVIDIVGDMINAPDSLERVGGMECYNGIVSMLEDIKRANAFRGNDKHRIQVAHSPLDLF